jgi:hypothetical protein
VISLVITGLALVVTVAWGSGFTHANYESVEALKRLQNARKNRFPGLILLPLSMLGVAGPIGVVAAGWATGPVRLDLVFGYDRWSTLSIVIFPAMATIVGYLLVVSLLARDWNGR